MDHHLSRILARDSHPKDGYILVGNKYYPFIKTYFRTRNKRTFTTSIYGIEFKVVWLWQGTGSGVS